MSNNWLAPEKQAALADALRAGWTYAEISEKLGVSRSTIGNYRKRLNPPERKPVSPQLPVESATVQRKPPTLEYGIRRALERALADGTELPRCPVCGAATFIGDRSRSAGCPEPLADGPYTDVTHYCARKPSPGSRYCSTHKRSHPDEPPLPTDEWGHSLRCERSRVPPWHCSLSTV